MGREGDGKRLERNSDIVELHTIADQIVKNQAMKALSTPH